MNSALRLAVVLLTVVPPWLTLAAVAQELPRIELSAGVHRIDAEVANTLDARMLGLMKRKSMPGQRGMLFVFDADGRHCMWMKNTLMPLSVAFLDGEGRIVNIEEMAPQTEDSHCATRSAHYALEMNSGWFKTRGIGPGVQIKGIDRAPSAR